MPDFTFERAALVRLGGGPVCGIDEAGRGPLAGPVVAAAIIMDVRRLPRRVAAAIDDSKALTPERRERVFAVLGDHAEIGIGMASVEEIDSINILQATFLAMRRAVAALPRLPLHALVDGNQDPRVGCSVETIVGGDALSLSIAAASIAAKVTRDRLMAELAREWPHYGWERNAGYGTPEHRTALERHGVSPHHRRTFMPVANLLTRQDS